MRITSIFLLSLLVVSFTPACAQNWLWGRGSSGSGVDAWPVATDGNGNVYVGGVNFKGFAASFGSVTVPYIGNTSYQAIIAKYDPNGNVQWAYGTQNGNGFLIGIAADPAGNSIMFGSFNSKSIDIGSRHLVNNIYPNPQYFLVKYGPAGNILWALNAGNTIFATNVLGNIATVLGEGAVACDPAGYIYITCSFKVNALTFGTTTIFNHDPTGATNDVLIAKYDPAGNLMWVNSMGGDKNDESYGLTVTPAGDIYIAGMFGSPTTTFGSGTIVNTSGNKIGFIARFNNSGAPQWGCSSGGYGGEYALGLIADNTNNVYLTGGMTDNSISFSGTTINNPNPNGKQALYLVKFDPSNQVEWFKTINAVNDTAYGPWGYSVAVSPCGLVWVCGVMNADISIDGNILPRPPKSPDPIFVAGYSSSGTYFGSSALASGGDDQSAITCDPSGNILLSSDYEAQNFQVGPDVLPFPESGSTGELLFVAKFNTISDSAKNIKVTKSEICLNNLLTLQGPAGYHNYLWNDDKKTQSRNITDTGTYWVMGYDSCVNAAIDTIMVTARCNCDKALFIPNSFTPNKDGENDLFYPRCGANITQIKAFHIYNRWGELMFEREYLSPNDASNAWDGTYKDNLPMPDVYVWVVEAICINGDVLNRKGSVTVIR